MIFKKLKKLITDLQGTTQKLYLNIPRFWQDILIFIVWVLVLVFGYFSYQEYIELGHAQELLKQEVSKTESIKVRGIKKNTLESYLKI